MKAPSPDHLVVLGRRRHTTRILARSRREANMRAPAHGQSRPAHEGPLEAVFSTAAGTVSEPNGLPRSSTLVLWVR